MGRLGRRSLGYLEPTYHGDLRADTSMPLALLLQGLDNSIFESLHPLISANSLPRALLAGLARGLGSLLLRAFRRASTRLRLLSC